jgi:hypothetical protein
VADVAAAISLKAVFSAIIDAMTNATPAQATNSVQPVAPLTRQRRNRRAGQAE